MTQIIVQLLPKSTLELKRSLKHTNGGSLNFQSDSPKDLRESWKLCLRSFVWALPPPLERERPQNQWISDSTWVLINQRAALRRAGKLNQCGARVIGRRIKAALKGDRKQRAATVGEKN